MRRFNVSKILVRGEMRQSMLAKREMAKLRCVDRVDEQ